jgi:hypothetical protein
VVETTEAIIEEVEANKTLKVTTIEEMAEVAVTTEEITTTIIIETAIITIRRKGINS